MTDSNPTHSYVVLWVASSARISPSLCHPFRNDSYVNWNQIYVLLMCLIVMPYLMSSRVPFLLPVPVPLPEPVLAMPLKWCLTFYTRLPQILDHVFLSGPDSTFLCQTMLTSLESLFPFQNGQHILVPDYGDFLGVFLFILYWLILWTILS